MKRVGDDAGIQIFSPGDEIDDPRERPDSVQHVRTTKIVYELPPHVNKVSDIGQIVLAGKISTSVIDDGRDVEVSSPKRTDGYLPTSSGDSTDDLGYSWISGWILSRKIYMKNVKEYVAYLFKFMYREESL